MPDNTSNTNNTQTNNSGKNSAPVAARENEPNACMSNLTFQITTARNTIPVKDAKVKVTRRIGDDIYYYKEVVSDISGRTEPMCIYSLPKSLSLTPDYPKPFLTYSATIEAEGFEPVQLDDIRAFTGVTSVQPVTLVPISVK